MDLSVVVVTYQSRDHILVCLRSLDAAMRAGEASAVPLDWDHASARSVDWVSGAAMLVRRTAIDAVGRMDEAFFMFNEDVDWCRRMNEAGWSVDYVPAASVVHHIGSSKGGVSNHVILER